MSKQKSHQVNQPDETQAISAFAGFIFAAGSILAVSYPVLALSTGVRAVYQIIEGESTNSPWLTLIAALFYTVAAIGFLKQPRPAPKNRQPKAPSQFFLARWWRALAPAQAWKVSLGILALEALMALLVGTLSYTSPGLFGRNVWQYFGKDYGYLPLIQPLLGLAWLLHPHTLRIYNIQVGKR